MHNWSSDYENYEIREINKNKRINKGKSTIYDIKIIYTWWKDDQGENGIFNWERIFKKKWSWHKLTYLSTMKKCSILIIFQYFLYKSISKVYFIKKNCLLIYNQHFKSIEHKLL